MTWRTLYGTTRTWGWRTMADLELAPWGDWTQARHRHLQAVADFTLRHPLVSAVMMAKTVDQELSMTVECQGFLMEVTSVPPPGDPDDPDLYVTVVTTLVDPGGEYLEVLRHQDPVVLDGYYPSIIHRLLDQFVPGETNVD